MNPVLSWIILLASIGTGYVLVKGVPLTLSDRLTKMKTQSTTSNAKKIKRRKSRAVSRTFDTSGSNVPRVTKHSDVTQQAATNPTALGGETYSLMAAHATDSSNSVDHERRIDQVMTASPAEPTDNPPNGHSTKESHAADQIRELRDPVEDVMVGRARTTSTPIGSRTNSKPMTMAQANSVSSAESSSDEGVRTHLAHSHWLNQRTAHPTDDMLAGDWSNVSRTMKILPSKKIDVSTPKSQRKLDDNNPTKKQRQNQAKKAKAKLEKIEAEQRQATALKLHRKNLENERMAITKVSEHMKSVQQATKVTTHKDNEWATVSKSRKPTNAVADVGNTSSDELIWH